MSFLLGGTRQVDRLSSTLERKDRHNFDNLGYNVQILIIVLFQAGVNLFGNF